MAKTTQPLKQHIPLTPGTVDRPRLLERLERAIEHRLTLVSAPPGYGKSTLVSQFARQTEHPTVWHTIEERERDLPALYRHMTLALQIFCPGIATDMPSMGEYSPLELAAMASEYLREHLTAPTIYVFDDVYNLDGAPASETFLRTLIERAPANIHFILISRSVPSLPFAEMIARSAVLALGSYELRMTDAEVDSLAELLLSTSPVATTMQEVIARLDGWPAGIMLALQPLPIDLGDALLGGDGGPEALFEALADRMLISQPPDLRHFLLTSSTLPYLTPELCSKVLEFSNPTAWLTMLQTRNLFVSALPDSLAYHPLFRNFLQRQLHAADASRYVALHTRAAHWFEDRDDLVRAFDHYMSAGLIENAAALAEEAAIAYFGQGRIQTLLSWSSRLAEYGAEPPGLLVECAMALNDRYEYAAAEARLDQAEKIFRERGDAEGLNKVLLPRAQLKLQSGDYHEAIRLAIPVTTSLSAALSGRALRIVGFAHVRLGNVAGGVQYLEEAVDLHRKAGLRSALSHLLQDLYLAYTRLGRLEDAGASLQEVVALRRSLGGSSGLALALNDLGYYHYQHSDYEQAHATLQEGLSVMAGIPDRRTESCLLWSMGDLKRDLGLFVEAEQSYDQALQILPSDGEPTLRCSVMISKSTLRRWQGQYRDAIFLADEALTLAETHEVAFESLMAQVAAWAARALDGQRDDVLAHLEQVGGTLDAQGARFELMILRGICMQVALLSGDKDAAAAWLRSAMQLAAELGTSQPLAAEIVHNTVLEEYVSSFDFDQLRRDVARLRVAQSRLATDDRADAGWLAASSAASLRVFTLGREGVEQDGESVPTGAWRSTTARELFLYLLFIGPQTRGDLGLVFWPDADSEQVRANFHTTLHRVRSAVGKQAIMFRDETYFINPELNVWCDAHALEAYTTQARILPPNDARAEALWRKAVALYQGEFLPSLDTDWVIERREMLKERYLEALVGLGNAGYTRNDLRAALDALNTALRIDAYREDVHRLILQCYARLGEKTQMLNHFNELRKLLQEELGIEPARETSALVEHLLS